MCVSERSGQLDLFIGSLSSKEKGSDAFKHAVASCWLLHAARLGWATRLRSETSASSRRHTEIHRSLCSKYETNDACSICTSFLFLVVAHSRRAGVKPYPECECQKCVAHVVETTTTEIDSPQLETQRLH